MKTLLKIIAVLTVASSAFGQEAKNIDFIAQETNGMIAVKKGTHWGFMDTTGRLTIPFREDLVPIVNATGATFPKFESNRAMITETKDNIVYFGFIDKTGSMAITAKFIRATPFNEKGYALAFELFKQKIGDNDILDKPVVRYVYSEVVIDTTGKATYYINEPKHVVPTKDRLSFKTVIQSYFITPQLVAKPNEKGSWDIINITKPK